MEGAMGAEDGVGEGGGPAGFDAAPLIDRDVHMTYSFVRFASLRESLFSPIWGKLTITFWSSPSP